MNAIDYIEFRKDVGRFLSNPHNPLSDLRNELSALGYTDVQITYGLNAIASSLWGC